MEFGETVVNESLLYINNVNRALLEFWTLFAFIGRLTQSGLFNTIGHFAFITRLSQSVHLSFSPCYLTCFLSNNRFVYEKLKQPRLCQSAQLYKSV